MLDLIWISICHMTLPDHLCNYVTLWVEAPWSSASDLVPVPVKWPHRTTQDYMIKGPCVYMGESPL